MNLGPMELLMILLVLIVVVVAIFGVVYLAVRAANRSKGPR